MYKVQKIKEDPNRCFVFHVDALFKFFFLTFILCAEITYLLRALLFLWYVAGVYSLPVW